MRYICIAVLVVLSGCADKESMQRYYDLEERRTRAILEATERQAQQLSIDRAAELRYYSAAVAQAARTPSATDDVLISFAWGHAMAVDHQVQIPLLPKIEPPPTDLDYLKAATPIVGMVLPFLSGVFSSSDGDISLVATDGGKINISSENAGSYNQAEDDLYNSSPQYNNMNLDKSEDAVFTPVVYPGGPGVPQTGTE